MSGQQRPATTAVYGIVILVVGVLIAWNVYQVGQVGHDIGTTLIFGAAVGGMFAGAKVLTTAMNAITQQGRQDRKRRRPDR